MECFGNLFLGQYEISLDSKNRISIPAKWRGIIGEWIYILEEDEDCLSIRKKENFEEMSREIFGKSSFSVEAKTLRRKIFGTALQIQLDKYKRFVLPSRVKEKFGLLENLILVGSGDFVEIWNKKVFEDWEAREENSYKKVAQEFSKKQ